MSGGVDSSVCAALLLEQGYDVMGITLQLWKDRQEGCGGAEEVADARRVAEKLGIPLHVVEMKDLFYDTVVKDFISEYEQGRTPNPCVQCNKHIKFGAMLDKARELGADAIATGHYALTDFDPETGRYLLKQSPYDAKDQSYVLYNMTQDQLAHVVLPLGNYTKDEIRAMAERFELPVAHKKDSQEICFIPDNDYGGFIRRQTGKTYPKGKFVNQQGQVIGTHQGIIHYTVGQRKGLGAFGKPMFVLRLQPQDNTILLGEKGQEYQTELTAGKLNWISIPKLDKLLTCKAKVRYKAPKATCALLPNPDGTVRVIFEEPQRAVTPGQAVVFYDGDIVMGGGTIL